MQYKIIEEGSCGWLRGPWRCVETTVEGRCRGGGTFGSGETGKVCGEMITLWVGGRGSRTIFTFPVFCGGRTSTGWRCRSVVDDEQASCEYNNIILWCVRWAVRTVRRGRSDCSFAAAATAVCCRPWTVEGGLSCRRRLMIRT